VSEVIETAGEAGKPEAAQAESTVAGRDTTATPPDTKAVAPAKESLAEVIRRSREDRAAADRAKLEHGDLKAKHEAAVAELARLKSDNPLEDPAGWAKARGMTPKEQALLGQALLYDLVPDKAPPELRVILMEARQAKKEREAEARRDEESRRAAARAAEQNLNSYRAAVDQAARSFETGSHPESEAWFGDDRGAWAKSLFATAENLAKTAQKAGRQADLSPANVARVLEAEINGRMSARDKRRAGVKSNDGGSGAKAPEAKTDAAGPTSTKGLNSGGPQGKALTDKERVARALAAGWAGR
jgi:hypothetical protein